MHCLPLWSWQQSNNVEIAHLCRRVNAIVKEGDERQRRAAYPDGPQPEERDAAGLRKSLNFKGEGTAVCRWLCLFCCAACPLAENTK